MRRRIVILCLIIVEVSRTVSQTGTAGGRDYALSSSSVVWLPHAGALFFNPAELARLHQQEFLVNTKRFSNLSSMSAAHFEPFIGTFAAGISNVETTTQYIIGYGRIFGHYNTLGGAFGVLPNASEGFTLSFGGTFHVPDSTSSNSGYHYGFSVANLSSNTRSPLFSVNLGGAYWVKSNVARLQAAWQFHEDRGSLLLGTEVYFPHGISVLAGTRSFQSMTGGVSFRSSYVRVEVAAGDKGMFFSLNFQISDPASSIHDKYYELGQRAYNEGHYYEARKNFLLALEYDEYSTAASTRSEQAQSAMTLSVENLLQQGKLYEDKKNLLEAQASYQEILSINPHHKTAQERLRMVEINIQESAKRLIALGDSLASKKEFERARKSYVQASELDPNNKELSAHIKNIGTLLKEYVQSILSRAGSYVAKGQLDDAQKEYERVLKIDPPNGDAKAGLNTIKKRWTEERFEQGRAAFDNSDYYDALAIFADVLQRDEKHREAKSYIERTREILRPDAEKHFKAGLQFYIEENYKEALAEWDKALLIFPTHESTLEYHKRAEEKLKALEKLN